LNPNTLAGAQAADLVLWIGISFEQSASVEYFRRVRSILASQGRLERVQQVRPAGASWGRLEQVLAHVRACMGM